MTDPAAMSQRSRERLAADLAEIEELCDSLDPPGMQDKVIFAWQNCNFSAPPRREPCVNHIGGRSHDQHAENPDTRAGTISPYFRRHFDPPLHACPIRAAC